MHKAFLAALTALTLAASPLAAEPGVQLLRLVDAGLREHGIRVDLSKYDTHTIASLYGILSMRRDQASQRSELLTELRKGDRRAGRR